MNSRSPMNGPSNKLALLTVVAAVLAFATSAALAQTQGRIGTTASSTPGPHLACVILPVRSADIGTQVAGVVASIAIERGDRVKKGQVLATMHAEVEQAATTAARSRADSEAEWRAAMAGEELAHQKLVRARALHGQNFISGQAVDLAESEHKVARARVAMAHDQRQVAAREANSAAAHLSLRTLRSPFDGVVTERFANPGERFEEKPLFRVADISRLRVDVVAPSSIFGRVQPNQSITVHPELPGTAARSAKVVQIDQVLDPASNTFRLRLDMDNSNGGLPAGLRCRAELDAVNN